MKLIDKDETIGVVMMNMPVSIEDDDYKRGFSDGIVKAVACIKAANVVIDAPLLTDVNVLRSIPDKKAIGYALGLLLQKNKLSQRQLAKMIGTSHVTAKRYVNGVSEPKLSTLYRICKVCGVDMSWFGICV